MKSMVSALAALTFAMQSPASAAELLMTELKSCSYCRVFNREMAAQYASGPLGRAAPLRRVDLNKKWPADLKSVERTPFTPVFILVEDGKEVGRIMGYSGAKSFTRSVEGLLAKLR
jgi:hypothetical protein